MHNASTMNGRAPTRELIDHWLAQRRKVGLGSEARLGRHAHAFADLWGRAHQDIDLCRQTITLFFQDPPDLARKNGMSIGTFQTVMDRCLQLAIDRRPHAEAKPAGFPSIQDITAQDAAQITAERQRREELRRARAGRTDRDGEHHGSRNGA